MAYDTESYRDEASPYLIKSAVIKSERLSNISIDAFRCITDLNIYEDISKPYLTGTMTFVDFDNIVSGMAFSGDEQITLQIKKPGNNSRIIEKVFYLEYVITSTKDAGSSTETYVFHLIEDSVYESALKNVNKYYEGKPSEIIENIIFDYIPNKKLVKLNSYLESDSILKVIVPNLSPLDAITWISKKALSNEGFPYFLFSSLAEKDYIFYGDLATLLRQNNINTKTPFRNWQSSVQKLHNPLSPVESSLVTNEFQILNQTNNNTDNLTAYIESGYVGSSHNYIDLNNGEEIKTKFDITKVFSNLKDANVIENEADTYAFPVGSKFNDEYISSMESVKTYNYPSTGSYQIGFSNSSTISEESDAGKYSNRMASIAIVNFLNKRKLTITLPGTNFIAGDINYTVGRKAVFEFLSQEETNHVRDKRKTGSHLITRVVHIFKLEDYHVNMDICKLESALPNRVSSSGGQTAGELIDFFKLQGISTV